MCNLNDNRVRLQHDVASTMFSLHHFFFQAEDGIRDYDVTGVQTCALPILLYYLPVIAVLLLLGVNQQATVILRSHDIKVGLQIGRGSCRERV